MDTFPDLDESDVELIRQVEENDDRNLEELAENLDLSKSAIHYRLKKLKESGVITSITANVDPHALGLSMFVITEVSVSHETGYADEIGASLAAVPGVQQVYYTMGDVDFIVLSRVQNHDQLNTLIDDIVAINGVNETSSRFVMKELKRDNRVLPSMSEEMIDEVVNHD